MDGLNDFAEILNPVDFKGKNIFFLQGPLGGFFKNTIKIFESEYGASDCFQLVLNKGDEFFASKKNMVRYRGTLGDFGVWVADFYKAKGIDFIFLLGDSREYHKRAISEAKKMGVGVYVFEEGYFRPNFITLEEGGVNENSNLPRDIDFYLSQDLESLKSENREKSGVEVGSTYGYMARSAVIYYILMYLFGFEYKGYKHHRTRSVFVEAHAGVLNFLRKRIKRYTETPKKRLIEENSGKYFFVVLQVREDFQVREHSKYSSIENYIEEILVSFKEHSSKEDFVVIKHHPMDRGKVDYTNFIDEVCFHLRLSKDRVVYVYDIPLPLILKGAKGCITINSTVGLQALYHGVPTKTTGKALYDFEGLTYQGSLHDFWGSRATVDKNNFQHYREFLINKTQVVGSFFLGRSWFD